MEVQGTLKYSVPYASGDPADITLAHGSKPSIAALYADTSSFPAGSVFVAMSGTSDRRAIRALLTMACTNGADDKTGDEDIYAVVPFKDTVGGVPVKKFMPVKLGNAVYTFGVVALTGLRTGHKSAKSVVFTSDEVSRAIGFGQETIQTYPKVGNTGNIAGLIVGDIGPAVGLLRVPTLGASAPATSVAPMHLLFR
jgi:hypothetical protein